MACTKMNLLNGTKIFKDLALIECEGTNFTTKQTFSGRNDFQIAVSPKHMSLLVTSP